MSKIIYLMHQKVFDLGSLISQAIQGSLFLSLTECEGQEGHFIRRRRSGWLGKKDGFEFLETKCIDLDNRMLLKGSRIGTTPPFEPAYENGNSLQTVIRTKNSITALCGWDNGRMAQLLTFLLHYSRIHPVEFQRVVFKYSEHKDREARVQEAVLNNCSWKDLSSGFYQSASIEVKTSYNQSGKFEEVHFLNTASPSDGIDLDFVTPDPLGLVVFLATFAKLQWEYFNGNDMYQVGFLLGGDRININATKDWRPI